QQRLDRDRAAVRLRLAPLKVRDVKQVIDQRQQVLSVLGNDVHVLTLVTGQNPAVTFKQQLREAEDRVQRRSQLVAHVGEELALVLVRALQLTVHGPQSRRLLGSQVVEVGLLNGGRCMLRKQSAQLDSVAIQRAARNNGQLAKRLVHPRRGIASDYIGTS